MSCEHDNSNGMAMQDAKINRFLGMVKYKLLIMSGKGGVGKSTVAANLALSLSEQGYQVGLLDVDVHGPSISGLLGLVGMPINVIDDVIQPYQYNDKLAVVTIQGLLEHPDKPLIWRGPMKIGLIRQFLADVNWGALDFLIIDSPPGTGDEPLTIAQTIPDCQAVIVTTPQELALADVRKSIHFCHELTMPIAGLIENMSGFICPDCGKKHDIFKTGGGERIANEMGLVLLGKLPIDSAVVESGDDGRGFSNVGNAIKQEMKNIVARVLHEIAQNKKTVQEMSCSSCSAKSAGLCSMECSIEKVAMPLAGGILSSHFGHCEQFRFFTIKEGKVITEEVQTPPPHAPGVIPNWLADEGCTVLIAGGIGEGAVQILQERGVDLIAGIEADKPRTLIEKYLAGQLMNQGGRCEGHGHGEEGHEGHGCGGGCGVK